MKSIVTGIAIATLSLASYGSFAAPSPSANSRALSTQPSMSHATTAPTTQKQASTTSTPTTTQRGPTKTGQPSQDCESLGNQPGHSMSAPGSAFNPDGTAGTKYAGEQPQNSRNTASVSQYDVACARPSH